MQALGFTVTAIMAITGQKVYTSQPPGRMHWDLDRKLGRMSLAMVVSLGVML